MNILQNLKESDPVISNFIDSEKNRQETHLELIASENFASIAVMQAQDITGGVNLLMKSKN